MRMLKKPRGSALFQYLRERLLSFDRRVIAAAPGLIRFSGSKDTGKATREPRYPVADPSISRKGIHDGRVFGNI